MIQGHFAAVSAVRYKPLRPVAEVERIDANRFNVSKVATSTISNTQRLMPPSSRTRYGL